MIRSTGGEGVAEFQEDEDAAEHTDEGGGGGDGPMLSEDLKCVVMATYTIYTSIDLEEYDLRGHFIGEVIIVDETVVVFRDVRKRALVVRRNRRRRQSRLPGGGWRPAPWRRRRHR